MDTNQDEHPPKKRKRKAADDPIKKTAVVITGEDIIRKPGSNEVPMPTTITLAKINKDKTRRKEISFTLSKTEEDMKEILKETFPILAGTERFHCAKSAGKVKLDFGEKRCIWSGKVINRVIKGDSVLYIFCEGEQLQDSGAFSTDSEQSEAHITLPPVGPNTAQITKMVPVTLALAPQPILPTGDLLEQIKTSTLVPQMENLQISSEDTEIQNSYDQASTETFTANGIQSGQQHTPVTVGVSHDQEENSDQHPSLITQVENMQISRNESSSEDRSDSGFETCTIPRDTSRNRDSLSNINMTRSLEHDEYRPNGSFEDSNSNQAAWFQQSHSISEEVEETLSYHSETERSIGAINPLELPPFEHNSGSEETVQDTLSRNSHSHVEVDEPNKIIEQEQWICDICPSSGRLEGGGDFRISWEKEILEHIQSGYAYFGKEVVVLTKFNKSTLKGIIPAAQEPGVVDVRVFSDTYELLGETKFKYEDMIKKIVSEAMQHGPYEVSKLFAKMAEEVCNQSSSAKKNSGKATGALNDGCQDRSLPGENTVMDDEYEDLAQHFQDIVKWLSEQSFHPVHSNTDTWLKLSNVVDGLCRKLACFENFKGNQQTCPQEGEENYFADTENSPCRLSEDDSISLSDPELPSKSGDDVEETWKTSTAPDDCPEKSFSPPLEDKPSDTTGEVKDNKEEGLCPEVVKAAESMVRGHQFHPNNPIAGQANVVYRDGQNVLENRSLSCAGFSTSLLDASRLETAGQFHQVIPSDAYGMDEEKKNGSVLKIETDPSLNSDGVSASGLPAVTSRSSWALYSEERTSHTLSASRDDTPVPCRDVPALNVENGESQYQDDALFKPPYTNAIPKPSESILSVTSNQQSTTHPGPITKEAAQSPLSNPMWNRDSKLNMAPLQCSGEEIHSGQEWEESGEGLASWFDLCENEDAGKDEHSRWEMSSMEPNKTDGGVERDVFDSEEGLSQGQRLFSEQGNSHIHLSLPDDTSVQSRRPEVENEEIQDTSLFTTARNGHTDIVRLLIENGANVNEGERDTPLFTAARNGHTDVVRLLIENGANVNEGKRLCRDTPLCEAAKNGHTDIVRLLIENGADVNKRGLLSSGIPLCEAAKNGHTDIVRLLTENGADVNKRKGGDTPLCEAAKNGHTDIVRLLIENGANVNEGELCSGIPLCEAARNGHTDIVRLLIQNGADVNKRGLDIPLCEAATNGHTDIARLLIENGADVNEGDVNEGEDTPLCEAAENGHTDIVRLLIENGADVNEGEGTSLLWAARNGHTDIVRLLTENGADVNKVGLCRGTPLCEAAENGHTDIVRLLIENGADVNKGERLCSGTPLCEAAKNGHTDIVRLLIENGADVNEGKRYTPLCEAAKNGHTDIVRLLIENGADVNEGGLLCSGTPLCEAAKNGHTDIVRLLIQNGADVNKRGLLCCGIPLCEAAKNGHTDIVRLLIENGADVNEGERDTPLCEAAKNGHSDIVRLLIENEADINKRGWDTPLCEAAKNGHTDIVRLLIENGADVNEGERDAPLFEAARNGHSDIVRLLIKNEADISKRGWRNINIEPPEERLRIKLVAGARLTKVPYDRDYVVPKCLDEVPVGSGYDIQVIKVPFEREYDVQPEGKKTASLPKMSGKKSITQTEMTCPRDIVEEGECGRDLMTNVELGLSCLHLSPECEQFYPCIMDESPGDSRL